MTWLGLAWLWACGGEPGPSKNMVLGLIGTLTAPNGISRASPGRELRGKAGGGAGRATGEPRCVRLGGTRAGRAGFFGLFPKWSHLDLGLFFGARGDTGPLLLGAIVQYGFSSAWCDLWALLLGAIVQYGLSTAWRDFWSLLLGAFVQY